MSIPAADSWSRSSRTEWFQYVAQFTCGQFAGSSPLRLVPGFYATAVSLYNANSDAVTLRKSLALAFPPAEQATGEVSDQIEDVVSPGTALQVDCEELRNEFVFPNPPPATDHVQGFLVIESRKSLHVEAVYTGSGVPGDVSIDTRQIAERKVIPRSLADKVKICHFPPGNPGNRHTILIDASALSAHTAHGDTVGNCPDDDDQGEDED
jgi:hypothetical protein